MSKYSTQKTDKVILWWLLILATVTALGAIILNNAGIDPTKDFAPIIILVAYSPSLAAIAAMGFWRFDKIKDLLKPVLKWHVNWKWYVLALLGPLILVLVAQCIAFIFGFSGNWGIFWNVAAIGAGMGALVAGSLGEEIGWRGFAQPILQKRYSALTAAFVVGVIWATWHLWPVFAPGGAEHTNFADILQTYIRFISTAVIYAWILNGTRSLLLVMLAHAGHNIALTLLPVSPTNTFLSLLVAGLYALVALVLVTLTGKNLVGSSYGGR